MHVTLNGVTTEIPEGSTAQSLIESMHLQDKRLAMEINKEIVPRSTFSEHAIQSGDEIEIVHAIGGG